MPIFNVCGTNYQYPNVGEKPWGTIHIAWASAVSSCLTSLNTQVSGIAANQFLNPMTTNGDLITQVSGLPARLGVGADGEVLTVVAGSPAWGTVAGTGNVIGPAGVAADSNLAVYDGLTGLLIKDGGITVASILAQITSTVTANAVTQSATTVFTSSGTWTKATLNPKFVKVTVIGGGGGGGGVNNTSLPSETTVSGGGGAGGCSIKTIMASALGVTETVTVGGNGNGGNTNGTNGTAGGTSSFGSHCQATGGAGGEGDPTPTGANTKSDGGAGGIGSGGDLNFRGNAGGDGTCTQGYLSLSGVGAGSYMGGSRSGTTNATGLAGFSYGGGGTGTCDSGNNTGRSGGPGADGVVIIEEYY